ncbi:AsnC family transcriptional regulator [Candidatus Woesearchaeota archaeon]|nr:AsnC family transcriptional regulator [Candidatus Woesearchaeota archaeon]
MVKEFHGEVVHKKKKYKLDSLDKDIITLLGINSRLSLSFIGKLLKKRPDTIKYRLDNLENKDIIPGYMTYVSLNNLKKSTFLILFKFNEFSEFENIIEKLKNMKNNYIIQLAGGNWDLRIYVYSNSIEEFNSVFNNILKEISGSIKEYLILQMIKKIYTGIKMLSDKSFNINQTNYRINRSSFQKQLIKNKKKTEWDEQDIKILNILHNNARISIKDLSEKIDLATTSIFERIKKLVSGKIITSFFPQVSLLSLGYQWYKILIRVNPVSLEKIKNFLKNHPNTTFISEFIGEYNLQASIFAKNQKQLYNVLREIRTKYSKDILSYETQIVFSQIKNKLI